MFKSITTWALLAAAIVQAVPAPIDATVEVRDRELEALLQRDLEPFELVARDLDLDERKVEERASRILPAAANFDSRTATTTINKEIGVYGGLAWRGFGEKHPEKPMP